VFHTLLLPLGQDAKDRPPLARRLGDPLEVVVGIGKQRVYVAAGKTPVALLKQAMRGASSKAGRKPPPVQFTLALGPLAGLAAEVSPEADRGPWIRLGQLLEQASGRVRLTAVPVRHGAHVRVEAEEGVFRALAALALPAGAAPRVPPLVPPLVPRPRGR